MELLRRSAHVLKEASRLTKTTNRGITIIAVSVSLYTEYNDVDAENTVLSIQDKSVGVILLCWIKHSYNSIALASALNTKVCKLKEK
jgi:hypothetical protein